MNCSKWALTLAELDASDLIRLASHSVQASSWRTGPPDTLSEREKTQRAAACSGLRMIHTQDMWHVCGWPFCDCACLWVYNTVVFMCRTCNNPYLVWFCILFTFIYIIFIYITLKNTYNNTYLLTMYLCQLNKKSIGIHVGIPRFANFYILFYFHFTLHPYIRWKNVFLKITFFLKVDLKWQADNSGRSGRQ